MNRHKIGSRWYLALGLACYCPRSRRLEVSHSLHCDISPETRRDKKRSENDSVYIRP